MSITWHQVLDRIITDNRLDDVARRLSALADSVITPDDVRTADGVGVRRDGEYVYIYLDSRPDALLLGAEANDDLQMHVCAMRLAHALNATGDEAELLIARAIERADDVDLR